MEIIMKTVDEMQALAFDAINQLKTTDNKLSKIGIVTQEGYSIGLLTSRNIRYFDLYRKVCQIITTNCQSECERYADGNEKYWLYRKPVLVMICQYVPLSPTSRKRIDRKGRQIVLREYSMISFINFDMIPLAEAIQGTTVAAAVESLAKKN